VIHSPYALPWNVICYLYTYEGPVTIRHELTVKTLKPLRLDAVEADRDTIPQLTVRKNEFATQPFSFQPRPPTAESCAPYPHCWIAGEERLQQANATINQAIHGPRPYNTNFCVPNPLDRDINVPCISGSQYLDPLIQYGNPAILLTTRCRLPITQESWSQRLCV
jgi:hypothetical protein